MELKLSPQLRQLVEETREWGRNEVRPAGLEADRNAAPLPPDHPYFRKFVDSGRPGRRGAGRPHGAHGRAG
jgi:acyl-CoA dehydrogenase